MPFTPSPEQIAEWKSKYGDIFKIEVDGRVCILKRPDRKTLSYASAVATKDPIKFSEIILNNSWLAGDEEIKTNDRLFMGAGKQLGDLIDIAEATLEKL